MSTSNEVVGKETSTNTAQREDRTKHEDEPGHEDSTELEDSVKPKDAAEHENAAATEDATGQEDQAGQGFGEEAMKRSPDQGTSVDANDENGEDESRQTNANNEGEREVIDGENDNTTAAESSDAKYYGNSLHGEEDELSDPCLDFQSDPADMTPEVREKTYILGQELQKKGRNILALKCYLRCLSGLNGKKNFPQISECLRNVAELYYSMEEYDKAVQFIQAEKVYYESELVDSPDKDGRQGFVIYGKAEVDDDDDVQNTSDVEDKSKVDVIRAQEYATLAQLCLDHDQPQMALEYQAKATKLRQKLLGDDHPVTQKSLNTFTVMYAEAGKKQYADSLKKYIQIDREESQTNDASQGLRHRKIVGQETKADSTQSDEDQTQVSSADDPEQQDGSIAMVLLILLFIVCLIALFGSGWYIYCRIDASNRLCYTGKKLIDHYYNKISYLTFKPPKSSIRA